MQVCSQSAAEATEGKLGCRVETAACGRNLPGKRRDEHDLPGPTFAHSFSDHPRHHHWGPKVHLEGSIDFVDREVEEVSGCGQRGVGDQYVDIGVGRYQRVQLFPVREIGGGDDGARLGGQALEHVGAPTAHNQPRTGQTEITSDCLADPACGSCQENGLALDMHYAIVAGAATVEPVPRADRFADVDGGTVLALFGPTAVGKSDVAIALVEALAAHGQQGVVIGADSMQLYAGLGVVSGAPTADQLSRAEHRLVGCIPIDQQFSAGEYGAMAHAEIDRVIEAGGSPIVVGGTGLYLQAALTELPLRPPVSPETEDALRLRLETEGAEALHRDLAEQSQAAAKRINVADERRLLRALALLREGHSVDDQAGGLWTARMRHPTRLIGLIRERDELYARIGDRVERIAASGGADEVAAALEAGASRTARMALGFRELQSGDLEAMKQATRRYAKRQLTWLGKLEPVELFALDEVDVDQVAETILRGDSARDA